MDTYKRKTKTGEIVIVKNNHQRRVQLKNPILPAVRNNFYRQFVPYNHWEPNISPTKKKWREQNNQLAIINYGGIGLGLGVTALISARKNPFRNIKPIPARTWTVTV